MAIYQSKPPKYGGTNAPSNQSCSGLFTGFWSRLFGGRGSTSYRKKDGGSSVGNSSADREACMSAPTAAIISDTGNTESEGECPDGVVNEVYID